MAVAPCRGAEARGRSRSNRDRRAKCRRRTGRGAGTTVVRYGWARPEGAMAVLPHARRQNRRATGTGRHQASNLEQSPERYRLAVGKLGRVNLLLAYSQTPSIAEAFHDSLRGELEESGHCLAPAGSRSCEPEWDATRRDSWSLLVEYTSRSEFDRVIPFKTKTSCSVSMCRKFKVLRVVAFRDTNIASFGLSATKPS